MRRIQQFLLVLVSALLGSFATWLFLTRSNPSVLDAWFEMKNSKVGYSDAALFGSDIRLPEIKATKGTVKFLPKPGTEAVYQLGYRMNVTVAGLDKGKIPGKYRKKRTRIAASGEKWEGLPLEQVDYEVNFKYELNDRDGFTLLSVVSKPVRLRSGQQNHFQDIVPMDISIEVAKRVKSVDFMLSIDKCLSCS